MTFTYPSHTTKGCVPLSSDVIKEENIFWEYESGTKDDRVQLNRLMEIVKEGDSITSLEVSRLTRSTQKLCEIIKDVQTKKIKLIIAGSLTVDCSPGKDLDPLTKGMLMMWGVFLSLLYVSSDKEE